MRFRYLAIALALLPATTLAQQAPDKEEVRPNKKKATDEKKPAEVLAASNMPHSATDPLRE